RKLEPMNLNSSVMVCSWEQADQCQSLCSRWLGACMFPGMIFETCHLACLALDWEASQSESCIMECMFQIQSRDMFYSQRMLRIISCGFGRECNFSLHHEDLSCQRTGPSVQECAPPEA
ncbi:hypothetical protein Cadr_000030981, partial [Camelus dromedarius]